MGEEYRLVADVEGEGHTRHDVYLRLVVLKSLGRQFGIRTFDQPRSWVHLVYCKDVGVVDFCSRSIEPSITVPVTYDGRGSFEGVNVNGKVVSDVSRDGGTVFELIDQITAQVTNFVVLTDDIWILQDLLIRVESVDTDTYVEDDVIKGEFVHDIARDVDGLISLYRSGEITRLVFLIEEVFKGWSPCHLVSIGIISGIVDHVVSLIEQVVRSKHIQCQRIRIDGIEVDVIIAVGIKAERRSEVAVKFELVVTNQSAVGHVKRGTLVGDGAVVEVQLFDVRVGCQTSQCPQPARRKRKERVTALLIFKA